MADDSDRTTAEEWAVAHALSALTTLDAEQLIAEARTAIQAVDEHRADR